MELEGKGPGAVKRMEFTLYYYGQLQPNGTPQHKHDIRRQIHAQIKTLWDQYPLSDFKPLLEPKVYAHAIIREKYGFRFAPLLTEDLHMVAELEITLLRPGTPGAIVKGGDLDNRIKTLLDALKVPDQPTALPPKTKPKLNETPFFCLLEDDKLVTKLSVRSDRLLKPNSKRFDVVLLIHVTTKQLRVGGSIPQMP